MNSNGRARSARQVTAGLVAAAIALLGTLSLAPAASAEDTAVPLADIEGSVGNLIIHKHAGTPASAGNGTEITDTGPLGVGLQGVEFTVARVTFDGTPLDLTTAEGWDLAAEATPALGDGYTATPVAGSPFTTDAAGVATGADLPFGLYLVTETSAGPNDIETIAQPFLVTLPYPDEVTSGWLYDVHVYPKNLLRDTPSKTVSNPSGLKLGDTVTWTLTVPVPRPQTGTEYTAFSITDVLDPRLELESVTVKLGGETLVEGTDFEFTDPTQDNLNTIEITPTLADLRAGQVYIIEIVTKVIGAGEIANTAVRHVNGTDSDVGPAQTNWGLLKLLKKSKGNQAPLNGAEFELYRADKTTKVVDATATAGGEILFPALWVGNGADLTEEYCLKETKAPAGYVLPKDPWTCVTVAANAEATAVEQTVFNTQHEGPRLPLTGAAGTALFVGGGIALILAAAGVTFLASRKKERAASAEW